MGRLIFVCPTTGRKVQIGLEIDVSSFAEVKHSEIRCPECGQKHSLEATEAQLEEEAPMTRTH
jgi:hypothetical protein